MDSERYDLHARLQNAIFNANVAYRDLKAAHHVAFTTFYQFVKNPDNARPKTISSVRLVCEFLEAALAKQLLPLPRERLKDKEEIVDKLYNCWWNNGKTFPETTAIIEDTPTVE